MSSLFRILLLSGCFGGLFLFAELLHRRVGLGAEVTRKTVHIGTGLLTLLFPLMLRNSLEAGLLCGLFFVILVASKYRRMLPSINGIARVSWGSTLYPVAVFVVFFFYSRYGTGAGRVFRPLYYFATPTLVMAICDPAAAWAGTVYRKKHPGLPPGKTLAGSFTFLSAAVLLVVSLSIWFSPSSLQMYVLNAIVLAFLTTLAERFSNYGTDNLFIPMAAMLGIYLMEPALKLLLP